MTVKERTEVIDDATKTVTLAALEGNVLLLYKSFVVSLTVGEGSVEWKIEFERLTLLSPPPEVYIPVFITASTLVDAYLLSNP